MVLGGPAVRTGIIKAHLCYLFLLSEPVLNDVSQTLQLLQRLLLFHSLQLILTMEKEFQYLNLPQNNQLWGNTA